MASELTRVTCRGRNGYGQRAMAMEIDNSREHTFLVRNRAATRSTLAMTRRPSATTRGITENWLSRRTSWATDRVAAAPDPMATPMSADLRASTSLTPSPVMATTWPRECRAFTMARFCSGTTRPNTECSSRATASASGSSPSRRASTGSAAPGHAHPPGDGAHGAGVVAGEDLDGDVLLGEVAQRLAGVGPQRLLEDDEGDGFEPGRQAVAGEGGGGAGEEQGPAAGAGQLGRPGHGRVVGRRHRA